MAPSSFPQKSARAGQTASPKLPCRVTVSEPGWEGARLAAIAAGCSSVSDMLEKIGRGELSIIESDAVLPSSSATHLPKSFHSPVRAAAIPSDSQPNLRPPAIQASAMPQHIHIHTPPSVSPNLDQPIEDDDDIKFSISDISLPRLIMTAVCAAVIIGSLLYIADRIISITTGVITGQESIEDIITPITGDIVAGYTVSDEYGIRPFHPVTGEPNVPHNGVDLAAPVGTPIYAVGKAGDKTTVKCWWDEDGGGWVVNQTAESYPGYVFQSLHMSENGCKEGESAAGEVIAYSGNSGLGTGEHYDFRVKINGEYVPPATKYLESAITGQPLKE